jgi:hypothetical protein
MVMTYDNCIDIERVDLQSGPPSELRQKAADLASISRQLYWVVLHIREICTI